MINLKKIKEKYIWTISIILFVIAICTTSYAYKTNKDYNNVSTIANSFVANFFRNINPFDYFEEFQSINIEYAEKTLKEVFDDEKQVISIIKPNKEE